MSIKLLASLTAAILAPIMIFGGNTVTAQETYQFANKTAIESVYQVPATPAKSIIEGKVFTHQEMKDYAETLGLIVPKLYESHVDLELEVFEQGFDTAAFSANGADALETMETFFAESAMQGKTRFTVVVSIYAGWMPWYYARESGIMKKWADRYGIEVDIQYMDYIPSVEKYVAQAADACVMTNMECLDMPAASGVESTALILGDFSNGNDKLLVRGIDKIEGLRGKEVRLVELSVSHYMLVRALEKAGMTERDVKIVNASDSDIGPIFITNKKQVAIVTWNPIAQEVMAQEIGVKSIFDSSMIPGEILDLMVVNTKTLGENPNFGRALVGAWYEVLGTMTTRGQASKDAKAEMARLAGCSAKAYDSQLASTAMFWTSADALAYIKGTEIKQNMDIVRKFCFEHGLLGEGVTSVDVLGISYPDGSVQGNKKNVRMHFDATYMQEHADGKITLKKEEEKAGK